MSANITIANWNFFLQFFAYKSAKLNF